MLTRRNFLTRCCCAIAAPALLAAKKQKDRVWMTGKLVEAERSRYFSGLVGSSQTAAYRTYQKIAIEGDTYSYLAQERLHWSHSKPVNAMINGTVKYAVEKTKLYVLDPNGKEHELEILKVTPRV